MSLILYVRKCLLPLIAVASFSMLSASPVLANDPPRVAIDGYGKGEVRLNNPVYFQGGAADPQRIRDIFGSIHNAGNGKYASKATSKIKFDFEKSTSTRWKSQGFNLKRGNYFFRISVVDGERAVSPIIEVPFFATGEKGANLAAAPANSQGAVASSALPQVTIQVPRAGAKLKTATAFSGIAKDDRGVVNVIATIMNTSTGQFLTPRGNFAASGQLKLRTVKGKRAQWSTPQMQLPPGGYLLSVKAIDTNGQEGKWSQRKFSIVPVATQAANQAAAATTVAAGAIAANGMAYCSGNSRDADGDGFGWQNQASCVVAGSKADTHPTCASSSSDPDGDGYGWENEKSCIVVVHCRSAGSDPDGDGFGWENNRSCIVLDQASSSRFPACKRGAASDPDGDGYGWEKNATCLVK